MKKPLRLIAALLAFCMAAAAFPTAGLAEGEESGYFDLRAAVENAQPGATITLPNDAMVNVEVGAPPWIISKNVTIEGNGHSVAVRAVGILLGADVTFQNMKLSLEAADGRNAIIANGHHLTLDRVTAGDFSINVFCGSFLPASGDSFSVPGPGSAGEVTIKGNTKLQGSKDTLGPANIYAGSLSIGVIGQNAGSEGDGPATTFSGDVAIHIEGSAGHGSLGTIYAGGGQSRTAPGQTTGKVTSPNPEKYKVSGTVTITGTNALPDVDGAGAAETRVTYNASPNTKPTVSLENISSFTMEQGKLILGDTTSLRDGKALSVLSGAELDVSKYTGGIGDFTGGGSLVLGESQALQIAGKVEGQTTVGIGQIFNGASNSPTLGHIYIIAPKSNESSFQLAPPNVTNPPALAFDGNGNWTAVAGSSSGNEDLIANFQVLKQSESVAAGVEAEFGMEATLANGNYKTLDAIPLTVYVGNTLLRAHDEGDYYTYADTLLDFSACVLDNTFCITTSKKGTHTISITVPASYTAENKNLTQTVALTVTDGGTQPDPGPVSIPVPTANTGLKWTGGEQTGVNEGTGYTLTGHKGTDVGDYTAIAALESNYRWADGSTGNKTIPWRIAKANGPAAPTGLAGAAPSTAGGSDGKITGTTAGMEYDSNANFTNAQTCGAPETTGLAAGTYYVRVKETATHEAGAHASITVPVPGAPTIQSISVNSTAHKTKYRVGDPLDVTGLTIEAVYSDGSKRTVPVTADMVSGFDSSAAAESQTLTILCEGQTAAYTVKITASEQPGTPARQLTVSGAGAGGTAAGVYQYEEGAEVTVRAGSRDGFTFAAWEAAGVTLASPGLPVARFRMPANDVTLRATWTPSGVTPPAGHTHVWDTAWKTDGACHWHDCIASGCPLLANSQKSGYGAHTAGDWVVDRPATATQSGTRHRSCTSCGYEMARETIPATGGGSSSGGGFFPGGGSSPVTPAPGGSSGSSAPVKNPDGSTTSTSTNKAMGTVTETTSRPDGSKTVVETQRDGTVTTTDTAADGSTVQTVARPGGVTETIVRQAGGLTAAVREDRDGAKATVRIPAGMAEAGSGVALPIPALSGENASLTIHTGSGRPTLVAIPIDGNDATTVACLVNRDGTETIVKTALLAGGQMAVSVPDGATVHIRDNRKDFRDVQGHWAQSAIDFVAARELFAGTASGAFSPEDTMSRAMLATVLARLDGVEAAGKTAYQQGLSWAVDRGISDGLNPAGQVTREQFVTMLYRYAGSPAVTGRETQFSDADAISAYARDAICWATEEGIIRGYEDGSAAPQSTATRAQAAAMLARYVEFLNQQ